MSLVKKCYVVGVFARKEGKIDILFCSCNHTSKLKLASALSNKKKSFFQECIFLYVCDNWGNKKNIQILYN